MRRAPHRASNRAGHARPFAPQLLRPPPTLPLIPPRRHHRRRVLLFPPLRERQSLTGSALVFLPLSSTARSAIPPAARSCPRADPPPCRSARREGGRYHSGRVGVRPPLRRGGSARLRLPPAAGTAWCFPRRSSLAAGTGESSAGKDSLVHHEAAESGAVAAAGWGLLRDVHGRGDQVRIQGRRWVVVFFRVVCAVGDYNSRRALRQNAGRPLRLLARCLLGHVVLLRPGPYQPLA